MVNKTFRNNLVKFKTPQKVKVSKQEIYFMSFDKHVYYFTVGQNKESFGFRKKVWPRDKA